MPNDNELKLRSAYDAEAELRKLALVASRTEDAVIITDADGGIEWTNEGFSRISGYSPEEVIGKKPGKLLQGPESDPKTIEFMHQQLHAGDGFRTEIINYSKTGGKYWLAIEVQPVRDPAGKITNFIAIERDITERKQATEELRSVKYTLDNTLDMIFMFDADSLRFVYLNKGAIASMGYSHEELLKMTPYDIKPQISEPQFRQLVQPLRDGEKETLHFETLHRRKDGVDFPVEIFLQLVNEEGNKSRFVAIVRDITERNAAKQDADNYTHSLERLHAITTNTTLVLAEKIHALLELGKEVFNLPLAIVSHIDGDNYDVDYISGTPEAPAPGTRFNLGDTYCVHTLKANHPTGFHYAGISEINTHPCYRNFGLESYIGTPLMVGNQAYGTLNFSGLEPRPQPFSNLHYSLIQLFAQWVGNQLEQQRSYQALHEATTLRQAILDSANLSIISTDVEGTILTFNKRAEILLGYRSHEVVGKMTPAIIHDMAEVVKRANELSKELGKTIKPGFEVFVAKARMGIADEQEWTYIHKNGTRFPVLLSATALRDTDGNINGFLGIASDITERKRIERMKSEFVSTVSHELRTPLTSIRGALGVVLGGAVGAISNQGREILDIAKRNCERLTHLINDLLDLEKIESGNLEFHTQALDLVALARHALEVNESYGHQHKVKLELIHTVESALIHGDEHRLMQVFANLISNAIKFSPENETVKISIEKHNSSYRCTVIDQGPGIPEHFRPHLFERFAQADSSDSREKGGTGLGLSISKVIIEQHHGEIDHQQNNRLGTLFYFDLPHCSENKT